MTIGEWLLEFSHHQDQQDAAPKQPGVLSGAEVERLKALIEE